MPGTMKKKMGVKKKKNGAKKKDDREKNWWQKVLKKLKAFL